MPAKQIRNARKPKKSDAVRGLASKIRAERLEAETLARRECYHEQAERLVKILDLIGSKRELFAADWYTAVQTLALLARELSFPAAASRAKSEVDQNFAWRSDFATNLFETLRAVGWCQALAGDELSCMRYLRLAQHVGVAPARQAALYVDRSYFAAIIGEHKWAANEFAAAEDLAERIAWENSSAQERIALLQLAELGTIYAPRRASLYLTRYNRLARPRDRRPDLGFDDPLAAMASYARATVDMAAGETDTGAERFRAAWAIFDRVGYDVRAAMSAIGLYRATGKSRWLHLAEDKLESYPRSWLARNLGKDIAVVHSDRSPLTRMQTAVMRLVCQGLSTDVMAERLELSRNTVLNHLKVVYRKLGINSREALVVEALRRGLA